MAYLSLIGIWWTYLGGLIVRSWLIGFVVLSSIGSWGIAQESIRHSLFIAGPTFTGILDESGREVWDAGRPGARDGWVLDNGNTVVNLTHGNKTVEFDAEGRIVWQASNADVPGNPFADPCGGQRLPNGNTVIASYGARGDIGVVKIFELNRDKQIVWQYTGPHRAHEVQVLTTNGEPIPSPALR